MGGAAEERVVEPRVRELSQPGDAASQRQKQQYGRVEHGFQHPEPLTGHRVIGGLGMVGRGDRAGEAGGHVIPVLAYISYLPDRQPGLNREVQDERREECGGQPGQGEVLGVFTEAKGSLW